MKIKVIIGSSILLGLMSAGAMAQSLPSSCGVRVSDGIGTRFYEPTNLNGAKVNILVWGNGYACYVPLIEKKTAPRSGCSDHLRGNQTKEMVAGTGFEPVTFGL